MIVYQAIFVLKLINNSIIGILFLLDIIYLLVGGIWLLIFLIRKGDIGDNDYGPDPQ